ncbi:MAG: hypothetical protein A2W80_15165 [Candidatus Riflebacteria bacterium GWC2_50_8]|nr:MAG: hypothetical protein A2W80_15165 [Candidatus Riflebacteria bacterium GWC2_50_8]
MKIRFLVFLIVCLFSAGCSGEKEIQIGENLSAEEQKIAFRTVLEGPYKDGDYQTAFVRFEKIAAQGNDDAAFFVALSYNKGRGVKKDADKGLQMLKVLAEKGYPAASDMLARELKANAGKSGGYMAEWLKVTRANADNGDRRAWEALADYYQKYGDTKNYFYYSLGLARLFKFSKADPVVAQAFLSGSSGTEKDLAEAIYWIYNQQKLLNASETLNVAAPEDRKIINFIITQKLAEETPRSEDLKSLTGLAVAQNHLVLELTPQEIHFAMSATASRQHDAIALLKLFLRLNFQKKRQDLVREKDAKGLYELAIESYQLSFVVFDSKEHAHETLRTAAEMGSTDAMLELGDMYCSNKNDPDAIRTGLSYIKNAAIAKDGRAYTKMAELFDGFANFSPAIRESVERAIQDSFEVGIAAKDPKAMLGLARFLIKKSGDENLDRIIELLESSSNRGELEASYELANIYLFKSQPSKRKYAFSVLEESAAKGHFASLALLFKETNKDCSKYPPEKIKEWLKNAAKSDRGKAHIFLMQHYFEAGKYKDAYRWVAASFLDDLNDSQQAQKSELNAKICKNLSSAEIQILMTEEVANSDELLKAKKLADIKNSIKTEIGLLVALLRYGFFENYGDFKSHVEYRPVLARLQELAAKDPEFYGFFLGAVYSRSFSTYYDIDAAIKTFQASAARGNPYSMLRLAQIYQRRAKTLFGSAEADALFADAAKKGLEEAKLQLGYQQLKKGNFSQALAVFLEPARNGNPWAMLALAGLYEKGLGTDKDLYQALVLYQQAAKSYLALYPFYERVRAEWAKNPQAEASGEFTLDPVDPAQAAADSMASLDTFLQEILKD